MEVARKISNEVNIKAKIPIDIHRIFKLAAIEQGKTIEQLTMDVISEYVKGLDNGNKQKKRISLEGIISGSTITDKDFEEVKKQWNPKLP
ncbi:hypothetical protein H8E77_38435 [bacterium]|nr:hypothetical protein [bacterium]